MSNGFGPTDGSLYRDEFGRPAVQVNFNPDKEERAIDALFRAAESGAVAGYAAVTSWESRTARRLDDVVIGFRKHGVKLSAELDEAKAVYGAIIGLQHTTLTPDLSTGSAEEIKQRVAEAIEHEAKAAATAAVKDRLTPTAIRRYAAAVHGMFPVALAKVRPAFAKAAETFTALYLPSDDSPGLVGIGTVTDAALADKTGDTVRRWHEANRAVEEMTAIADFLVLANVTYDGQARSRKDDPALFYVLHGDVSEGDIPTFLAAAGKHANNETFKTDLRTTPATYPMGIYPHLLDAGIAIELPESREAWEDRKDEYVTAKDILMAGLFR